MESSLVNERDITQVVILGAGFDTRFSRLHFPSDREIRLIEIDAPQTQIHKQSILASLPDHITSRNVAERPAISYVPVNFEVDTIESALLRSTSYNPAAKTLFLWEAVTPYLTSNAVDTVINFVKEYSGPGSTIAFDVRYEEAINGSRQYRMTPLASTVGKLKEPFKFGVPEGTSRQWASSRGLDVHTIYTPAEFAEYLTSDESYSLDLPDIMDIIVAKTPVLHS
jgi:methyltransferase (TIGR00027 family)